MNEKVNINLKVEKDVKELFNQLVVLKTSLDNKKSSQREVFEEALVDLLKKYNKILNQNG